MSGEIRILDSAGVVEEVVYSHLACRYRNRYGQHNRQSRPESYGLAPIITPPLGGTSDSRVISQIIRTDGEKLYGPSEFTVKSFSPVCRRLEKQKPRINETPPE